MLQYPALSFRSGGLCDFSCVKGENGIIFELSWLRFALHPREKGTILHRRTLAAGMRSPCEEKSEFVRKL